MAKIELPDNALPRTLVLSIDEINEILHVADQLIAETLHASEDFIVNGRQLDQHHWKYLATREKFHIFRTRSNSNHMLTSPLEIPQQKEKMHSSSYRINTSLHKNYLADYRFIDQYRPPNVPLVIASAIKDGTVEDVAFGALADTEERLRLRNSYVSPDYDDHRILAILQRPNEADPFQCMAVKWSLKSFGPSIPPRDVVYVESTGLAFDSNGERVHYILAHSIELKQVPPLTQYGFVRMQGSTCFINRTFDSTRLESFCRCFNDLKGELTDYVSSAKFAEGMIASNTLVQCSYVKKLTWLMHRSASSKAVSKSAQIPATECSVCSIWLAHAIECQMCCSQCSVSQQVSSDYRNETDPVVAFCLSCVREAKELSAWDVAITTLPMTAYNG